MVFKACDSDISGDFSIKIDIKIGWRECTLMAHLHCGRWTWVQTWIRIPNPIATLYWAEHVRIAQTRTLSPTPYFCIGRESESESVPESVSGNPLFNKYYL